MKKRSKIVLSGMFLSFVTACASDQADWSESCRNDQTNARANDDDCEKGKGGHSWVYGKGTAPAVGHTYPVHGYTTSRPSSGSVGRAPASGGFGGSRAGTSGGS